MVSDEIYSLGQHQFTIFIYAVLRQPRRQHRSYVRYRFSQGLHLIKTWIWGRLSPVRPPYPFQKYRRLWRHFLASPFTWSVGWWLLFMGLFEKKSVSDTLRKFTQFQTKNFWRKKCYITYHVRVMESVTNRVHQCINVDGRYLTAVLRCNVPQ